MENRQGLYAKAIQAVAFPVKASTHIYKGEELKLTSGVVEGVATSDTKTLGVSMEEQDNSSGAAGDLYVLVELSKDQIVKMKQGTGTFAIGATLGIGVDAQTLDQDEPNKTHTCVSFDGTYVVAKPIVSAMQL